MNDKVEYLFEEDEPDLKQDEKTSKNAANNDKKIEDDNKITSKKDKPKKKLKLWQKFFASFMFMVILGGSSLGYLLYGPYPNFRNWLITTAMTTMNHKYLATWFYDDDTIEKILKDNYVADGNLMTDASQISFVNYASSNTMYKNKYEKEILTKDNGNDLYKKININEDGLRGYLIVIYDPSKVKIGTAKNMGTYGDMLPNIAEYNNAVIAMNASGFSDPNKHGNGGTPHGMVIQNGKLIYNAPRADVGGGIIGFTYDNKLVLGQMSADEALQKGVRDAVEFGPYLIVNGEPAFIKGNGGWGTAPRSAIAQRKDGIVLFLVMDGRDYAHGIDGADMVQLTEILMKYGAYNAANLDGGTSSGLVIDGKFANKPMNGSGVAKSRAIPNAWIVTE